MHQALFFLPSPFFLVTVGFPQTQQIEAAAHPLGPSPQRGAATKEEMPFIQAAELNPLGGF
jgi:hypothetical protein